MYVVVNHFLFDWYCSALPCHCPLAGPSVNPPNFDGLFDPEVLRICVIAAVIFGSIAMCHDRFVHATCLVVELRPSSLIIAPASLLVRVWIALI